MRTLLILIIAGFALLVLGSPDRVQQARTNFSNLVSQLPEQVIQGAAAPENLSSVQPKKNVLPDFSHVGEQEDIPAEEVLGQTADAIIPTPSPRSAVITASYGHQDQHTIRDIHDINASTMEILDRISANYQ